MAPTSKNQYVVEKIVGKRNGSRGIEYLVQWQGWGPASNTWEPIGHLNCHQLVKKFEKENATELALAKSKGNVSKHSSAKNQYKVEKIVGKRMGAKGAEYRVKWLGYSSSENTWEPIGHLNCPKLVQKYEDGNKPEASRSVAKRTLPPTTASNDAPRSSNDDIALKKIKFVKKEQGELKFTCLMADGSEQVIPEAILLEKHEQEAIKFLDKLASDTLQVGEEAGL